MTIKHIGQLTPDRRNARSHNPRNIGMIVSALNEVGAARSIVIDEDGVVLAGNGTLEAAAEAGIERVVVVPTDGETIVAVQRTGLNDAQKRRLALLDNRTAELAEWDSEVLAQIAGEGPDLDGLWTENELNRLLGSIELPDDPRSHWTDMLDGMPSEAIAHRMIRMYFKTPEAVEAFAALLDQPITDKTKTLWFPPKSD